MIQNKDDFYLSINKEELSGLRQAHFNGEIVVVDKVENVPAAVDTLRKERMIGFDTETKPSFKRGHSNMVSLIQLSTENVCFLFRLNEIGFDHRLKDLLEDGNVIKIGASVHDDFLNLKRLQDFNPEGFIDIQQYVKQFKIEDNSLARIYGILFNERISKNQRLTNWEQSTLTSGQQSYAALDAYACLKIFKFLKNGEFNPASSRFLHHTEEDEVAAALPAMASANGTAENAVKN